MLGTRDAVAIGPGTEVDLDHVVGEHCTLADALGPELLAAFDVVTPAAPDPSDDSARIRSRVSRRPTPIGTDAAEETE